MVSLLALTPTELIAFVHSFLSHHSELLVAFLTWLSPQIVELLRWALSEGHRLFVLHRLPPWLHTAMASLKQVKLLLFLFFGLIDK
jgi:hypothetical protein